MPSRHALPPPPSDSTVIDKSVHSPWPEIALGIALFIAIVLVYVPSLSAGFIWDDDDYVTQNLTLQSWQGLWKIWMEPAATPQYYPVVHTSFWIEYHLWGLNPVGFHFVNILLHAANSVLVAVILRKLKWPGAWLAAAIFGLHPVHVESVSWVTERKNVLSGLFYLLSLYQLLSCWGVWESTTRTASRSAEKSKVIREYFTGTAFYIMALLSKSVTCSLPAVVLLILWQKRGKVTTRDLRFLAPLFMIGLALSINTIWLERTKVGASGKEFEFTAVERLLIAGRAVWFYAGKLVWPSQLSFIYPRWPLTSTDPLAWSATISACLIPIAIGIWARKMTGSLVAVLFFYGTLLPALGFFNIYPMRFSFVADHFQYLASLGVISLAAALICRRSEFRSFHREQSAMVRLSVCVVCVTALAVVTWQRQFVFYNQYVLWTDTLAKNPTCMLAHFHLGRIASSEGRFAEAEHHFQAVQRYRIDDIQLSNDLRQWAGALAGQKKYTEAIQKLREALSVEPSYFDALNDWGTYEAEQGHHEAAIRLFERALAENPSKSSFDRGYARLNLATSLWNLGRTDEVERELRAAIDDAPADVPTDFLVTAQFSLAQLMMQQNRLAEANQMVRQVLRLSPNFPPAQRLQTEIHQQLQLRPGNP